MFIQHVLSQQRTHLCIYGIQSVYVQSDLILIASKVVPLLLEAAITKYESDLLLHELQQIYYIQRV